MSELRIPESEENLLRAVYQTMRMSEAMDLVVQGNAITLSLISVVEQYVAKSELDLPDEIIEQVAHMRELAGALHDTITRCAKLIEGE